MLEFTRNMPEFCHNSARKLQKYARTMPEICQKYARNIWPNSKKYVVDFAVYHEYTFVYLAESNVFQLYVKRMLKFTQPSNSLVGISRSEVIEGFY